MSVHDCQVDFDVRPMRETDKGLVIDSWYRSYAKSRDGRTYPEVNVFYDDYIPVVRTLVARSDVYLATLKADDEAAVAWLAVEGDVLHYVFVKRRWRQLGIAKELLTRTGLLERPVTHSHRTLMCEPSWVDGVQHPPEVRIPSHWQYRKFKIWKEAA